MLSQNNSFYDKGSSIFKWGLDLLIRSTACICKVSEGLSVIEILCLNVSERVLNSSESTSVFIFFLCKIPGINHIDKRVKGTGRFEGS